ncbi:uncharacterized protein CLUP02_08453 [Colletotrichum lupini]|uniref:Uncharacterized protein n=1 Tax=Colletotrichum lupini TaxID=145971 RepID=A0A9Q8ST41_9PEZI|nr:uncharacterized protein CLUP02_08453 [Colletotrichum lupini]UQC82963.1 hypothetical protein CLUP02_08453 [Colletotrichum lupini]
MLRTTALLRPRGLLWAAFYLSVDTDTHYLHPDSLPPVCSFELFLASRVFYNLSSGDFSYQARGSLPSPTSRSQSMTSGKETSWERATHDVALDPCHFSPLSLALPCQKEGILPLPCSFFLPLLARGHPLHNFSLPLRAPGALFTAWSFRHSFPHASIHIQMVIHLHPKSTSIAFLLHPATLDPLLPKKNSVSKGTPESREAMPFRGEQEHLGSRPKSSKHALPDHDATYLLARSSTIALERCSFPRFCSLRCHAAYTLPRRIGSLQIVRSRTQSGRHACQAILYRVGYIQSHRVAKISRLGQPAQINQNERAAASYRECLLIRLNLYLLPKKACSPASFWRIVPPRRAAVRLSILGSTAKSHVNRRHNAWPSTELVPRKRFVSPSQPPEANEAECGLSVYLFLEVGPNDQGNTTAYCNLSDNVTPAVVSLFDLQPQLVGYSAAPSSVWIAKLQPFLGLDFVLDLSILFSLRLQSIEKRWPDRAALCDGCGMPGALPRHGFSPQPVESFASKPLPETTRQWLKATSPTVESQAAMPRCNYKPSCLVYSALHPDPLPGGLLWRPIHHLFATDFTEEKSRVSRGALPNQARSPESENTSHAKSRRQYNRLSLVLGPQDILQFPLAAVNFFDIHIRIHSPGDCLFLTSSPKTNSEARAACLEPIPPEDPAPWASRPILTVESDSRQASLDIATSCISLEPALALLEDRPALPPVSEKRMNTVPFISLPTLFRGLPQNAHYLPRLRRRSLIPQIGSIPGWTKEEIRPSKTGVCERERNHGSVPIMRSPGSVGVTWSLVSSHMVHWVSSLFSFPKARLSFYSQRPLLSRAGHLRFRALLFLRCTSVAGLAFVNKDRRPFAADSSPRKFSNNRDSAMDGLLPGPYQGPPLPVCYAPTGVFHGATLTVMAGVVAEIPKRNSTDRPLQQGYQIPENLLWTAVETIRASAAHFQPLVGTQSTAACVGLFCILQFFVAKLLDISTPPCEVNGRQAAFNTILFATLDHFIRTLAKGRRKKHLLGLRSLIVSMPYPAKHA